MGLLWERAYRIAYHYGWPCFMRSVTKVNRPWLLNSNRKFCQCHSLSVCVASTFGRKIILHFHKDKISVASFGKTTLKTIYPIDMNKKKPNTWITLEYFVYLNASQLNINPLSLCLFEQKPNYKYYEGMCSLFLFVSNADEKKLF